eukprot:7217597-Alexandrium_andersonii.AAC.1
MCIRDSAALPAELAKAARAGEIRFTRSRRVRRRGRCLSAAGAQGRIFLGGIGWAATKATRKTPTSAV